jgi:hypothetical protein
MITLNLHYLSKETADYISNQLEQLGFAVAYEDKMDEMHESEPTKFSPHDWEGGYEYLALQAAFKTHKIKP